MTLKDLKIGRSGRVLSVGGEKTLRRRLLEMGVTPGTVVTVKKTAPMGDPVEIILRGYVLSLRLEDAEKITIEELPEKNIDPRASRRHMARKWPRPPRVRGA